MDPGAVGEVTDVSTVGLGAMLLWQIVRLVGRVQSFLESLTKHHEAVEAKLDDLIEVLKPKPAAAVPTHVKPEPTPIRDVSGSSERSHPS